ncbi:MAG: hybrid sensor histidine kinase/response regulator [Chthoniobacteraceae bacterium]
MSTTAPADLSSMSLVDLFRIEAEAQTQTLTTGLLALERNEAAPSQLESLMRAAHSLKGAARIVGLDVAVKVAHAMEDIFVAAQKGTLVLGQSRVDVLLSGVDLISRISQTPEAEIGKWDDAVEIEAFLAKLAAAPADSDAAQPVAVSAHQADAAAPTVDRVLRVTADHLNRLLGLAGESLVEARWLDPFSRQLLRLKRMQQDLGKSLEALHESVLSQPLNEHARICLATLDGKAAECRQFLGARLVELEMFDRRSGNLSHRLYDEALALRMRPFSDRALTFPRMVRDVARTLGKEARLEIVGEHTQVDRDLLEKLDAPLTHLLRNAVDHGIEFPDARVAAGKPREGTITLEARHSAGMLVITVRDDGAGIDVESVRRAVVAKALTNADTAAKMSDAELLEFLFLPGFTMKEAVTEISGRGVGLDVVQDTMKQVRGTFRTSSEHGKGTTIQLQLPLTLSVLRALVVEIAGEPYGVPLAAITRTLRLSKDSIESLEGRQHFAFDDQRVGLVTAHQIFDNAESTVGGDELDVVIIGERGNRYGLVVDRFLGERELVVQPLDPRLGKIKDISAGALTDDGAPLLIVDVDDLLRSVEWLSAAGRLTAVQRSSAAAGAHRRKRVLVVDDSLTVRELERKLLEARGYEVEIAVDGMDGWNALRTGDHDLVITDVDMPRLDGIELVSLIRKDPNLKSKPVMIVSYKDREEDRARGLEAGADFYLTKGSFHDESLISSVSDLIGEP